MAAKTSESQTTNSTANEEKLGELVKSRPTVDEVAILKEELEQLKVRMEERKVTITFELKRVEALLAKQKPRYSKDFACGGELMRSFDEPKVHDELAVAFFNS